VTFVVFAVKSASIEPEDREVLKLVTVAGFLRWADNIHANRSLKEARFNNV
jgi:hypothetical protein